MVFYHKIEYVIFDMDGLLIDSESIYTDTTNEILGRYGKEMTWDIKSKVMGTPQTVSSEITLKETGLQAHLTPGELLAEQEKLRLGKFKEVEPMPGAVKLVRHLHAHKIPMAVATGSSWKPYLLKTGHLQEIFGCFPEEHVVTADAPELQPGRGKPCPDVFLIAARRINRKIGQGEQPSSEAEKEERGKGLVLEDAIPGTRAGVAAGMNVVWIPDARLRQLDPDSTHGSSMILDSLVDFRPEEWGLPPYED